MLTELTEDTLTEYPEKCAPVPDRVKLDSLRFRERRLARWVRWSWLLLFGVLAGPLLAGRVYVADDLGAYHLPLRAFYAKQIQSGEPFDWMPSLHAGFYLTGEGQAGTYHPLHWLLYRWLPLGTAFDLEILLSYPVLALGTYLLARIHTGRRDAALYAALVFTFAGFNLLHFVHPNAIAVVSHIPWLLLAIDVALSGGVEARGVVRPPTKTSGRRLPLHTARLAIGLLTASQLLLGYPQYVWFSLVAEGLYLAWRARQLRAPARAIAAIGLAKLLGVTAGAVQLLPSMDALTTSTRSALDTSFVAFGSLHPLNLVQLVGPYLFQTRVVGQNTHELGLYAGAVPLVLSIWLLSNRRSWGGRAPAIVAATSLTMVGLFLALGEFSGASLVQTWIPMANRFRLPARAIVLVHLGVALLSALGLATILDRGGSRLARTFTAWPMTLAVAASAALAALAPFVWPSAVNGAALVWLGPILILAAAMLVHQAARGRNAALVALVIFTAVDAGVYGFTYAVYPHTAKLETFAAQIAPPPAAHPGSPGIRGRVVVRSAKGAPRANRGNQMLLSGVQRVDGYTGLKPRKLLDYSRDDALRAAGVTWILYETNAGDRPQWQAVERPLARARLVTAATQTSGTFSKVAGWPDRTATVDAPLNLFPAALAPAAPSTAKAGTATITDDRAGAIDVHTLAPTRQLLVLAESYHRGWRATIDGQVVPVLRVNGDFMGCVVPAGVHLASFSFCPESLHRGKLLSSLGLSLMLCIFVLGLARSRLNDSAYEPSAAAAEPGAG